MNKILLLFLCSLMLHAAPANAQAFIPLATDSSGDAGGGTDIRSVSYRVNFTTDSIWFKIVTYNAITASNDFGLEIGIDTNMNIHDGVAWDGANTSMKYDHALFVMQDLIMPGFIYAELGQSGTASPFTIDAQRPDNYTWLIRTKLSALDQDGNFNLLVGGANFNVSSTPHTVADDAPDSGYLTITRATGVNTPQKQDDSYVWPNPCFDVIRFSEPSVGNGTIRVTNITGQRVATVQMVSGHAVVDVSGWSSGLYGYEVTSDTGGIVATGKFTVRH